MIIIGERINSTRKQVKEAIESQNRSVIEQLARFQTQAGANYLDLNGGHPTREAQVVEWLLDIVQNTVETPVALDSSNPQAILAGLKKVKTPPIINSISLEADRLKNFLPIIRDHDCQVIALLMSDAGVPSTSAERQQRAEDLVGRLLDTGKKLNQIYIDPCFLTVYSETNAGLDILDSIRWIRNRWPEIHISGGISNASHGLPNRKWINLAYLVMGIQAGMDAAIVDPCVEGTLPLILAAEVIANKDEMALTYTQAAREGRI